MKMSTEDSNNHYGDVMDETNKEPEVYDNIVFNESEGYDDIVFTKVGGGKIRTRLLWSFMMLIALTLVVIAITIISQTYAQKTINELVRVQGKIARLSLETDKTLRIMQGYEKDFLLNQERIGIRKAKELYLDPFVKAGGDAYQTLYQIQQLATATQDLDAVQQAMDSINEYLTAFVGTVDILEKRVDKEFGELVKLRQSLEILGTTAATVNSLAVNTAFSSLNASLQDYLAAPNRESLARVNESRTAWHKLIDASITLPATKDLLKKQLVDFDKWLVEVANTDSIIAARISGYQEAAKRAEPAIKSVLDYAVENEAAATAAMEHSASLVMKVVLVVGIVSILLGVFIAIRLSRGLTTQVNHIMGLLDEIGMGNYQARTEVVSNDELGVMATTLNAMLDNITTLIQSQEERDSIQDSIMRLLEDISALSDGDFTARAEVTEDMTGAIADSFNAMADQFTDIISKVKAATESVDITSEQVATQTMGLAEKTILQAKGVADAVEAIEEMVKSIREVANNALQSASVSKTSRLNAQEGALAVSETSTAMVEIREQINETARSIKRLGESSLEIGNIVQIIDDIADRTSILALNASIQAAMAGDAGHGFAVVADEVQRLADSSSNSTKQIELLVKSIQMEIKDVTNRIDESIGKVVQGTKLADGAHNKLQEIENVASQLSELIEAITTATTSQVKMSETISRTMEGVGEVSRESSLSSQDTATSMSLLIRTARDLRSAVEVFQIEEQQPA
ncbi:methyl-accepting chemotaxis protein [Desulfopila sp. IMCC35006]|uniref:methyl-accepting chemotaxis protein n=1 Tax=Desulfopila sp. IMCC35006 TaxID=2569542 RepID=UPI00142F0931|nr:HAMP domain-containing methyl-accepting chemotaxis protein [Desulfopila sp. IMCC35006]